MEKQIPQTAIDYIKRFSKNKYKELLKRKIDIIVRAKHAEWVQSAQKKSLRYRYSRFSHKHQPHLPIK